MNKFTATTREMVELLGLKSEKTLFRRRTDYPADTSTPQFLERGIHFQAKTPGASQLSWDPDATTRAWNTAVREGLK